MMEDFITIDDWYNEILRRERIAAIVADVKGRLCQTKN
jgi:hypothetical protein